jgi:hypothetical protein
MLKHLRYTIFDLRVAFYGEAGGVRRHAGLIYTEAVSVLFGIIT